MTTTQSELGPGTPGSGLVNEFLVFVCAITIDIVKNMSTFMDDSI